MKKTLLFLISVGVVIAALGCKSGSPAASDDKALRQNFAKQHFEMKDVPENERPMVQGYIDRAKQMAAQGKSPGEGK